MKTRRRLSLLFSAILMISMFLPIQASAYGMRGLDARLDGPAAPSGLTPTAPTFKGGNDGTIGGVTTDMEYSIDDGENWIPVNAAPITGLRPGKVLVRVTGTDTVKPGDSAEVTVPDYSDGPGKANGPAAPSGLVPVAPTSVNGTDGNVRGVDETMEYSTDGGNTWKPVVGTKITGLISGTNVSIRVKETETTNAGATKMVVIPDFIDQGLDGRLDGPAAPSGLMATAPTSKDGNDGAIGGMTTDMEYSIDDGENWIPVTTSPITGLASGKVLVRYAGTDTVKPGDSAEVTVPDYFEVEDSNSTLEPDLTGSVLSQGNLTVIVGIAAAMVFGFIGFMLGRKRSVLSKDAEK